MGKGGQATQRTAAASGAAPKDKSEVLIDGRWYDVAGWKHPGGSIIKLYAGKDLDATQAFHNFHNRSLKAKKFLDSRPSREATGTDVAKVNSSFEGQAELLDDYNKLTDELRSEGFFDPAPGHVAYRLSEIVLMHALGFYLLFNTSYTVPALAILGLVSGRCGWLMHEGGHFSLTGKIPIDRALQVVLYGTGCGMSASWWRNQHNKHHSMPQKHGADPDLNTLPLVAFTEKVVKRIGFPMKLWLRMQGVMFPVLTCQLVALGWQFYLHPRHIVRTKNPAEALSLFVRLAAWTAFITTRWGFAASAAMYLAYNWVASTYIFINFAVSHTHLPVVDKDDEKVDWVRYAANHTMNVSSGPFRFVDWWMSFLNFQIEHHLFPSMPQFRHPIVSKRVQALFKKHGLPYIEKGYFESLRVTFSNLDKVGADVFYG